MPKSLYLRTLSAPPGTSPSLLAKQKHRSYWIAVSCVLTLCVFVVDLSTPADVNVALLYTGSILACFWTRSRRLVWGAACASLCLSVVAVVVGRSPHPGALQGVIWANRSITALAELALAGVVSVWMRTSVAAAEDHLVLGQLAQTFDLAQAFIRRRDGEIVYWSRGAQDLYGWSAEEAVGRVSHELLRTTFPEELARIESEMSKVSRWSGELRHLCKNGEPIWVAEATGRSAMRSRGLARWSSR